MTPRHALLETRLRLYARHLGASKRPILLGPWHSELGFEALYWLPFLSQLRDEYGWDKTRLVALSRGGMAAAYDTAGRAELFDYLPVETLRLHTFAIQHKQASVKQYGVQPWEQHAVALAASALGLNNPLIFHPSWMYRLFDPAWRDAQSFGWLSRWLSPKALPLLPLPDGLVLPERFIAVRFYGRATLEPTDSVLMSLRALIGRLSTKQPIVFLCTDDRYDDHADVLRPFGANMVDLGSFLTPTTNLAVQLAVLQRAALFLGTYGGLSQLAMRAGIPTVACYTKWQGTAFLHSDLTHRLALTSNTPFQLVNVGMLDRLELLM
jgi:hypothetical protein